MLARSYEWIERTLFGYDFFISYSWNDPDRLGRQYALALKDRLTDLGYSCFLDSADYEKGADWEKIGRLALSRTQKLLLVGTPAIFHSKPVVRELRLFRATGRDLIPVDIAGTLAHAPPDHPLTHLLPGNRLRIQEPNPKPVGGPSDSVTQEIHASFRLTQRRIIRRRAVLGVMLALAALAGWSELQRQAADRARDGTLVQFRQANVNLAQAHEAHSKTLLTGEERVDADSHRRAFLHALAAQRQPTGGTRELSAETMTDLMREGGRLPDTPLWSSPRPWIAREFSCAIQSPDRTRLATGDSTGALSIWDMVGGRRRLDLQAPEGHVTALAFDPEGRTLASAHEDGTVRLWRSEDGEPIRAWSAHRRHALALAFDPRGRRLASAGDDGVVLVWDLASGKERLRLLGHGGPVNTVAFHRWEDLIATGGDDGKVRLWWGRDGGLLRPLEDEDSVAPIQSAIFHPDGKRLASSTGGSTVLVWDVRGGRLLQTVSLPERSSGAIAFDRSGRLLHGPDPVGRPHVFDLSTGQDQAPDPEAGSLRASFPFVGTSCGPRGAPIMWDPGAAPASWPQLGHSHSLTALAFHPSRPLLASASLYGSLRLWDTESGRLARAWLNHERGHLGASWDTRATIHALAYDPRGGYLASGGSDGTIELWREDDASPFSAIPAHRTVMGLAFDASGSRLASAGQEPAISLWAIGPGGLERRPLEVGDERDAAWAIAYDPDGAWIASTHEDGTVRLWDNKKGGEISTLPVHSEKDAVLAVSTDGSLLATGGEHGGVRLADLPRRRERWRVPGECGERFPPVYSLAFDPSARLLAGAVGCAPSSYCEDRVARVWTTAAGKLQQVLAPPSGAGESLAFDPVRPRLATAGNDGRVHLWAIAHPMRFEGRCASLSGLAVGREGQWFASVCSDDPSLPDRVNVWDGTSGELVLSAGDRNAGTHSVAIHPTRDLLATGHSDGAVRLWRLSDGYQTRAIPGLLGDEGLFALLGRHDRILSVGTDGALRLTDLDTGNVAAPLQGNAKWARVLAVDGQEKRLAVGGEGGSLGVWDLGGGRIKRSLNGHRARVLSLAFSPDGLSLASADFDLVVYVWDTSNGKRRSWPTDKMALGDWVAFTPDGDLLAIGSSKGVRFWDPLSGQERLRLPKCRGNCDFAFTPDGQYLAQVEYSAIQLWDLRTFRLLDNGPAPSPRAALISEVFYRLWGYRPGRSDFVSEEWTLPKARQGYHLDQEIEIDVRPAAETAIAGSKPRLHTFDIRPLLDPPKPDQDKLDQILAWLEEQEREVPSLKRP